MSTEFGIPTKIAWRIRDIHHRHKYHHLNIIAAHGLHSGQPRILYTILEMDGATQKEIADRLNITPASLAVSVKRMEKANLITKDTRKPDLRSNSIRVTEEGKQKLKDNLEAMKQMDAEMLKGFSEEETNQLYSFLNRMNENLMQFKSEPSGMESPDSQGREPAAEE